MNQHSVINEKMNLIAGKPLAVADILKMLTLPPRKMLTYTQLAY